MKRLYIIWVFATLLVLIMSKYTPTPRWQVIKAQASEMVSADSGENTPSDTTDPININENDDLNLKDIKLYVSIILFVIIAIILYKFLFGGVL